MKFLLLKKRCSYCEHDLSLMLCFTRWRTWASTRTSITVSNTAGLQQTLVLINCTDYDNNDYHNKVSPYRDVTVLARHAMSAARLPTRPVAGPPPAGSVTDDDDDNRRQMPAIKTILAGPLGGLVVILLTSLLFLIPVEITVIIIIIIIIIIRADVSRCTLCPDCSWNWHNVGLASMLGFALTIIMMYLWLKVCDSHGIIRRRRQCIEVDMIKLKQFMHVCRMKDHRLEKCSEASNGHRRHEGWVLTVLVTVIKLDS